MATVITVLALAGAANVAFARLHPPDARAPWLSGARTMCEYSPIIAAPTFSSSHPDDAPGPLENPQDVMMMCSRCHRDAGHVPKIGLGGRTPGRWAARALAHGVAGARQ